jgi:spermidine/putrescine transport system substrate-binding protein
MIMKLAIAGLLATTVMATAPAQAETLRLLTWGSYAPDELVKKFEEKYPDITVEVTFSNNEEMIAKLRATGGAGFDLAQPSHDRIYAVQQEYNIYKPLDLSKINTDAMQAKLLDGVKANTTIDGEVYAVPHQWGTSGLMANKTMAPDVKAWGDLCDPQYGQDLHAPAAHHPPGDGVRHGRRPVRSLCRSRQVPGDSGQGRRQADLVQGQHQGLLEGR